MSVTDVDLVRRAEAGDRTAMTELLSAHDERAFRLAVHVLGNRTDAEDATQNAFVKAFTELGSFDDQRPFAPWLIRIVAHESRRTMSVRRH